MTQPDLVRRLIDQARQRVNLLSAFEAIGKIDSLAARHQAEMLKRDAESITALLADPPIRLARSQEKE